MLSITLPTISGQTVTAGAPLNVALNGSDSAGNAVKYTVSVTNAKLTNASVSSPQLTATVPTGNPSLKIVVSDPTDNISGDMVFELFQNLTPNTVSQITSLVSNTSILGQDFYNGLTFSRVLKGFMIQGGDPNPSGSGSQGSGTSFDDEFNPNLQFSSAGVLALANSGPDTNSSQFFITTAPYAYGNFRYTIFGFLTQGSNILNEIQDVSVKANSSDEDSEPVNTVTMTTVTTFTDTQDGVLQLSAPSGTTGTADVTVTATDSVTGVATSQTFAVTVGANTNVAPPYLTRPISPIQTNINTPVTFSIPATNVSGKAMDYTATISPANSNLAVTVNANTGQATLTPSGNVYGVFSVQVGVSAENAASGENTTPDTQLVPVYVDPAAPASIQLLSADDSGNVTDQNNTPGRTLQFEVSGVLSGANVQLFSDGTLIGSATAAGASVVITTNGSSTLADGSHAITATQTLTDQTVSVGNLSTTTNLASTASTALTIKVDATAPVLTPAAPAQALTIHANTPWTASLAQLINNGTGTTTITDADAAAAVGGIAVTATTGKGTWYYSLDGTTFLVLGAVTSKAAVLLPKSATLRYVPDGTDAETATITYCAWDGLDATGASLDTTVNGGATSFSTATDTVSLVVTSAVDNVVLKATNPSLGGTGVSTAKVISLTGTFINSGAGTTTITLAAADTNGVLGGIAVTGTTGKGTWAYSLDGTNFTSVGTVSDTSALLLPATATLRYTPDGTDSETATITYRAWDATSGTAGTDVDTTSNGGSTAFSLATDTASLVVNSAPVLTAVNPSLGSVIANGVETTSLTGTFINSGAGTTTVVDTDGGAVLGGIALTGTTGNGTWDYSLDGTDFIPVGTVAGDSALLLPKTALLRYIPNGTDTETATITYRAWDTTSGSSGTMVDTTSNGGTTAFSANSDTASLTVTSPRYAPVLTSVSPTLGSTLPSVAKTIALTGTFINNGTGTTTISDITTNAVLGGIALTGTTGKGTWAYSLDGTTFTSVGTVSDTSALLLPKTATLRYTPDGTDTETATITYYAWDATGGTSGAKVDTTSNGGSTPFSAASDTASLDVTSGILSGYVYFDADNSGQRITSLGQADLGLGGMTVRLFSKNSAGTWPEVAGSSPTQTAADGSYSFADLLPGTYRIQVAASAMFVAGKATAGNLGGTADQVNSLSTVDAISFAGTENGSAYNFGIRGLQPQMISLRLLLADTPAISQLLQDMHSLPVVTLTSSTAAATYGTGGAPVAAVAGASISSPDSPTLSSATVAITNPQDGTFETLAADTTNTPITASYADNVLTLSGVADVATYETVLSSITYSDTGTSPHTGARTISVAVNDGTASSAAATTSLTVQVTTPSGYSITADADPVNVASASSTGFTFAGAVVGDTYQYSVTSSGGGTAVTGSGTVSAANQNVSGINVSSLPDGTLTYSVALTDPAGSTGPFALATTTLNQTAPPSFKVTANVNPISESQAVSTSFTFADAEQYDTYQYTVTSSGGGTAVTGNGTVSEADQDITGINVRSLSDGTLTYSVTITNAAGNSTTASTTATLDQTPPSGYQVTAAIDPITTAQASAAGFILTDAQIGTTYQYTVTSNGAGSATLSGNGPVSSSTTLTVPVNVATLPAGTLTYTVTLTDVAGNVGTAVTTTATLD